MKKKEKIEKKTKRVFLSPEYEATEAVWEDPALQEVYEESGLHADVHQENHQPLKINEDGIFFKMMRSQSYYNELISEYFWVLEEVGPINDAQFASGMLKFNFDPKNYFHKRLVVFQFLP